MKQFQNKRALVTGASSGIGQAIAAALATEGAQVHAVARSWAKPTDGWLNDWCLHNADFTVEADVRRLAAEVSNAESPVDLLIHCAGALETGLVADFPIAQLDYLYQVNVRAPFLLTQLLLPALTQSQGQIVFINSSAAIAPNTALAVYSSAKAALKSIADCLRLEVNASGVRVMSVYPGKTASAMQQRAHELAGKPYDVTKLMQPQDVAQMVLSALALPKTAEMTDLHIRPMQK
jgi:short-subunit dehydrogenase